MQNSIRHDKWYSLVHFMLYICMVHYKITLMKIPGKHVFTVFHTRMFIINELKYHNQTTFNVILSDKINIYKNKLACVLFYGSWNMKYYNWGKADIQCWLFHTTWKFIYTVERLFNIDENCVSTYVHIGPMS